MIMIINIVEVKKIVINTNNDEEPAVGNGKK